jgi:hypothetical protein
MTKGRTEKRAILMIEKKLRKYHQKQNDENSEAKLRVKNKN